MKNRDRGKRAEAFFATDLGGKRMGVLSGEDVQLDSYSLEIKSREKIPKFIEKAMNQAVNNCPEGKVPVFILHCLTKKHDCDIIMLYYKDFKKLIKEKQYGW